MNITAAARANHDELFPDHQSKLAVSDPEFVELFDNFAFDELIAHSTLDTRLRMTVILAALIAMQTVNEYRVMLGGALNVGVTPVQVKEILYHAVPYVGQARAFDFFHATNDVLTERGVAQPLEGQSTTTRQTRHDAGLTLRATIFGGVADTMYAKVPSTQLRIQEHLSANCFGDYWTRTGLDLATRELLTFSMLASMGGCENQLRSHIQGNLNVGNDKAALIDVLTQLLPWIGYPRTLNALAAVNEVIPEPSH